ncbi:MAG: ABC transporter ATP-binding protein [Myxococcota bacterium]
MRRLRRFWTRFLRRYRVWYGLGIVFLVATNALTVAIPGFVQRAIDALSAGEGADSAIPWAWAVLGAGVGIVIVRTLSRTLFFNPGRTVEFRVKNGMFDRLLDLPRRFFDRMRPGEIISRGTNDTNAVRTLAGFVTLQLFNVLFMLLLTGGRMTVLNAKLALICGLPLVVAVLVLRRAIRVMFRLTARAQQQIAVLSDRILETYNGVGVVHAFNALPGVDARFDEANDELLDIGLSLNRIRAWLLPVVSVVGNLCVVLLLFFGGRMVVAGELTVGELAAFAVYINILVSGLTSLGWMIGAVQRGWIALGRVDDVLYVDERRPEPLAPMPEPGTSGLGLEATSLGFTYPGADAPALQDVSLRVRPGEVLGVFGLTGAGKSTLLDLLSRVREPPAGTVSIDHTDVRDVPVRDYWARVAYVTQEPFLFSASIRDNVVLAPPDNDVPVDEERLRRAVEDAALDVELESFSDGLDTVVGERGITLSGGQRQRVALARAFYRDFDVLLLDDVLSAVDHATEKRLVDAIYRRLRQGGSAPRTAVVVSHRVSVLARSDRVVVLEDGRVVDRGHHRDLLARGGPYAAACRLQEVAEALEAVDGEPREVSRDP